MRELAEDGIIDRKRKSGTRVKATPTRQAKFVIPLVRLEVESLGKNYRYSLINKEKQTAPGWLRGRLGLPSDSEVLHLECMHYADGKPFQYENRWINLAPVEEASEADFEKIGPNEWLVNKVPFTDAELTFSASIAAQHIADLLAIEMGVALFTTERTTWLDDIPVTYAQLYFHPGYQMTTRL
jgi:GntR family histidine utilization transcriptional repressor